MEGDKIDRNVVQTDATSLGIKGAEDGGRCRRRLVAGGVGAFTVFCDGFEERRDGWAGGVRMRNGGEGEREGGREGAVQLRGVRILNGRARAEKESQI